MPLTDAEQRELDQLEYDKLVSEQSQFLKGQRPGPLSRTGDTSTEGRTRKTGSGVVTDLALEAGIPMAGQALVTEFSPLAQAAVGGGLSALGNVLAQARRMAAGEQEDFSGGQVAQATLTGAIPFLGPARNAERMSRPIIQTTLNAAKTAGAMGVIGLTGEALKTEIDEGRLPNMSEALTSAAPAATIGGTASVIRDMSSGLASAGRRVAENAKSYDNLGAPATPGMLLPEDLAATEAKIAARNPGGKVAQNRDSVYQAFNDGIQGIAPEPKEGAAIFKQVSPLMNQISDANIELRKLNQAAQDATEEARAAFGKLQEARVAETSEALAAQQEQAAAVRKEAEKLSAKAFNANLESATENARELAALKLAGGAEGVDPATARNLFVEHVAKPVEAAFEERSAQLYSGVNNKLKTFDATPIMAEAERAAEELTGGYSKKLDSAVNIVQQIMGDEALVSLQQLRNARAEMLRKVRLGEFGSENDERLVKGIAAEITKQIDAQAVRALGEEGGAALKAANQFYRETRPLFDQKGVEVLFSQKPGDEYVKQVLDGMKKSGVNSDEYQNLKNLIVKIGEFSPDLADAAKGHVNDLLKRSVIFDASRISPNSPVGELVVDPSALLGSLEKLGKVPGTLEQLGLGSPGRVAELQNLFSKYPDATAMTSKDWESLFSSPSFRQASSGRLATEIEPIMADAQANTQLVRAANLKAAGKVEEAKKTYEAARETVTRVHGDLRAVQDRYEALLKDPLAIAFNNPNLPDNEFNSFARALFDPKANKVTNADVSAMADALRSSKNPDNQALLLRLQERYIADRAAKYHTTPISSEMLKYPDAKSVDLFFNPVNPGDASNEIERARALLSPEQFRQLESFAKTARAIGRYEKLGATSVPPGSFDVPVVGVMRRGLDAVADLYRQGKYSIAASLLADPAKFSRIAIRAGDEGVSAAAPMQAAGQGLSRGLSNELPAR